MNGLILINCLIFVGGIIIYFYAWKLFGKKNKINDTMDGAILMRPIRVVDVDFKGSFIKGVVDPHHGTAAGTWIYHQGCFYHKLGRAGKWELSKKITLTPARVVMFAKLMSENNINYKLIEKSC